ncbi:flagellar hook-associated protein FlgK [Marinicauda pacifica]|uniref:Flagellar hook-associated protein 1 n=1 Tax=Marinicauda pacifica TaxID=1133559 RepID=A0A4S2HCF0_9PROT|nr:flagellar hook-associated protein FlgK [Marinicauda pacifica]TGY93730.1 flagellar hook-associated protein FlgK [Marinicauda pacifica]GGE29830.1 flagellar hook-associated protein FlgK [Marinicauda pacifica]
MSMSSILGSALSGLQAAQLGMRSASNNVANVNTPGYARSEIQQIARSSGGQGAGVEVTGISRVVDEFLVAASIRGSSDLGRAELVSEFLDRIQSQFGSTDEETSLFGRINQAFAGLAQAAADPTESVSRLTALSNLEEVFDEATRLSSEIRSMRNETDRRVQSTVERVNEIVAEFSTINGEMRALTANAMDTTGSENRQAELIDELSTYLDIRVEAQPDGRVFIKTQNGVSLLDNEQVKLDYVPAGTGAYGVEYGAITAQVSSSGARIDIGANIKSGELRGLMDLRDKHLPQIADELAELTSGVADALNAAHNDASAYPAPNALEGRNTGLIGSDVLRGSGEATIAITAGDGTLVDQIDLVFNAAGFTVNGTPGNSMNDLAALISAASPDVTATFANGELSLTASAGNGVATMQNEANPSSLGGRGLAHYFGLNDLVDSRRPGFFDTALTGTSAHGLAPGGELGFSIFAADGRKVQSITVPVAGASVNDMIAALNNPASGLGQYGTYAMDANGKLSFTPTAGYKNFNVSLASDTTQRGTTGLAFSQLFGVGDAARMARAETFEVSADIRSNTSLLAMAKLDIDGATVPGDLVLSAGDSRGGQALQGAVTASRTFNRAGSLTGGVSSVEEYAARLAGDVGSRAAVAERSLDSASAIQAATDQKRSDVEGVNMDEELARMTMYQQAYNASARLMQAAKEMTDTLLNMV